MRPILTYEQQYLIILRNIRKYGYRQLNTRTGYDTLRIPHEVIQVDLQEEFPILQCKEVLWKSAMEEILWIMQKQSNNIKDLKPHIWDKWADDSGSIGKAYGYQYGKPVITPEGERYDSQVHYVLDRLVKNSSDRRAVLCAWDVEDMHDMHLVPCVYTSVWTLIDDQLNCLLTQRSADFLVGVPFNTTQYAILTHLFARHLGVAPGLLTHVMADCHVYCCESHLNGMETMLRRGDYLNGHNMDDTEECFAASEIASHDPSFKISSPHTEFWKIDPKDCEIINYSHFGHIPLEVVE